MDTTGKMNISQNNLENASDSIKQMLSNQDVDEKSAKMISSMLDLITNQLNKNPTNDPKSVMKIAETVAETMKSDTDINEDDIKNMKQITETMKSDVDTKNTSANHDE
jgi:hypothetical protein